MTKTLTIGEKSRRANIRKMKAQGVRNARVRAATKADNVAEHEARNEDRRILAIIDRRDRQAEGIARRDAHNAALSRDAARRRVEALLETDLDAAIEAVANGAPMPILRPDAKIVLVGANDQAPLPLAA